MKAIIFFILLLGFFIGHCALAPKPLSKDRFGKPVVVVGCIVGIPTQNKLGVRFLLKTRIGKLRLSWYQHKKTVHAGERWRLTLKLKPIHGLHNPGGFNVERWAKMQGIVASGYIVQSNEALLLSKPHFSIDAFRERVQHAILYGIPSHNLKGIINALSIGSKNLMSPEAWLVFQRTGTSHLMAISGLHVGLVVLITYFCANGLLRLFPWVLLRWPAQRIASVLSVVVAWGYGLLVGMSLPTQRAVIMVTVFMLLSIVSRPVSIWKRLLFAFFLIIAVQPLAITSPSFWLSFLAVFWIAYAAFGGVRWLRVKLVLSLGLLPITLYCFHQAPLMSIVVNIIAIPWVTILVVPLCLLASVTFLFSNVAAVWVWHLAATCFSPLFYVLQHLSNETFGQWLHPINDFFELLSALLGVLFLVAPRGLPLRFLGVVLMLPLLMLAPERPKVNSVWLTVLDVGQGLATVIQTAHHVLIYDAGPRFPTGFDAGRSVITPFLQTSGIQKINTLVVSHDDNDHIGGSFWLVKHFPITTILSSIQKSRWHHRFQPCFAGQEWEWDGVQFHMLWPPKGKVYEDNNSSCVLRISVAGRSVLLTGDIEKPVEQALVLQKALLSAEVLVAPHHGSRSSSTPAFVQAVHPKTVIMSVGYQNRYHFPAKSVMERYHAMGAQIFSTSERGALRIMLGIGGRIRHNGRLIIR